ncbi:MAG TPA: DUF3141 domain-containing protein [Rhizomicrobium sp.]|nr:DUF3141 domain-containing protein [Rhizomicrobium sp.]
MKMTEAYLKPHAAFAPAIEYMVDFVQRSVLFLDVLRQRGNQRREHLKKPVPNVLDYKAELLIDGRTLDPPVNYLLAKAIPPEGDEPDPQRRPFVIVDPRAGHGPGIGGFKADSEIGVAFKAGHPCYVIGFLPEPVPGQSIQDIAQAQAVFLEKVIALHPDADGKPCVIGNCQGGWAVAMLAALRTDLFGPIIVAGTPLSYWAGIHGKYPMRYSGGLTGGSWITSFLSDLGAGKFDGAWLVQNFENQNPSNTLWTKQYELYANIDTEPPRYLQFEKWWGGHVLLDTQEIEFIVEELFVGNHLVAADIRSRSGDVVDLRNIRSPIVVFCSHGDNITPPQQALGWITDLYQSEDEIRSYGQTIVYAIHETAGHLGLFVSGTVARKEHGEFTSNIDLIDTLPPGLYEAVFVEKQDDTVNADLVTNNWIMKCAARTLDDIRALGGNDSADERRFAAAARVSELNSALYRTLIRPLIVACVNPLAAEWFRRVHPLRLQYEIFSDANPLMAPVGEAARHVRGMRKPAARANPFLVAQESLSKQIVGFLDNWRDMTETIVEQSFLAIYGNPVLQSALGVDPYGSARLRAAPKSPLHKELLKSKIAAIRARIATGGIPEAVIRGLIYAGMTYGAVDERGFETIRRLRMAHGRMSLAAFKSIVRDQSNMLLIDQKKALDAIPDMLPPDYDTRQKAFDIIKQVLQARGARLEDNWKLREVETLFLDPAQHDKATALSA